MMKTPNEIFGPHLVLDFPVHSDKLNDVPFWEDLLVRLVEEVDMNPLSPAFVYPSTCTNESWDPPTASGVSGIIVLAESHISFHTFVEAQFVFLDLFSCKPFDEERVKAFLTRDLGAYDFSNHPIIERGANFPRSKKS